MFFHLKDPLLGVSKLDSLPILEEDVNTKTGATRLQLLVRFGPAPFELSLRLSQIDWKVEKHTPFGVSTIFEMHPCPC